MIILSPPAGDAGAEVFRRLGIAPGRSAADLEQEELRCRK